MRTPYIVPLLLLLLLVLGATALAQNAPSAQPAEESVDSNEPAEPETTTTTTTRTETTRVNFPLQSRGPKWLPFVRLAARFGPIVVLLLAWSIAIFVHHRLVRREQALFPAMRGSRAPQLTPLVISAALFIVPFVLFAIFDIRARKESRLHLGGVIDEWQPVASQAWIGLTICFVLALLPWLFARRADTVS